ncbi:glycan-binding surface protein [Flavobacterium piscis]|uniref:Surface glycan-binding protein B xyloglucan binding domain-containing protein n=1 Tax=Flavobacterium piscis TaxID=1114874 RepID=A0ABU1Y7R1_9FLAO|nr:glycan-binding surface protein [Flavobacterium piscis]MDR7210277.1 hypothetical protein [Flavobacterium piscis]
MKKILNNRISHLLFLSMMLIITILTSCNNDDDANGTPVIAAVRNYAPAPNDTLVTSIVPGQWIVIHGKNLKGAIQISINGSPAQFDAALFSDKTAVLQVPMSVPFNNVDPEVINTIKYVTNEGTTTYKFKVNAPPATITGNSLLASNKVGDSIYIYGTNLYLIEKLTIGGVDIAPLKTVSNGSSIGFVFPEINAPQPWEAVVVAASGTYTFSISIQPEILAVSYVNPSQGDIVRVYGKNLNGVTNLKFGGATISSGITESPDGFWIQFVAPNKSSYAGGPVTITSTYGTVTTAYDVNNNGVKGGLLATFEWDATYFGYTWWQHLKIGSSLLDFNGSMGTSTSQVGYFDTPILAAGESNFANMGSSASGNYWIPVANISDPVEKWGLQFDISVAKPWNGSTLYFQTAFAGDTYVARYEPWKIPASNKTLDFKTDGWQTVIIPLSEFRKKDADNVLGNGVSLTSLSSLLGPTGSSNYVITLKNFGTASTKTGFYAAIDNIRVVKIK